MDMKLPVNMLGMYRSSACITTYTTCLFIQTSGADWCWGRWLANLDAANLTLSATPLLDQPSGLANTILTKCRLKQRLGLLLSI